MRSKSRRPALLQLEKRGRRLQICIMSRTARGGVDTHSRMSSDALAGATLSLHLTKACRTNTSIESQRTWRASNRLNRRQTSPYVSEALGRRLA
jgi:hypothetical protein